MQGRRPLAQIQALQPRVIIVEGEKGTPEPCGLLTRLLQDQPEDRVVRVSLEDTIAVLYTGHWWTANRVEDLDPMAPHRGGWAMPSSSPPAKGG